MAELTPLSPTDLVDELYLCKNKDVMSRERDGALCNARTSSRIRETGDGSWRTRRRHVSEASSIGTTSRSCQASDGFVEHSQSMELGFSHPSSVFDAARRRDRSRGRHAICRVTARARG